MLWTCCEQQHKRQLPTPRKSKAVNNIPQILPALLTTPASAGCKVRQWSCNYDVYVKAASVKGRVPPEINSGSTADKQGAERAGAHIPFGGRESKPSQGWEAVRDWKGSDQPRDRHPSSIKLLAGLTNTMTPAGARHAFPATS